ncbi:hypothetical protein MOTC310_27005 [Methylobacterium oryzae]|uniref:Uncharacterized protein n=1 Tax=Methylobacterium oryzae TaxID=334852 RepID=A0ABU7TW22_9HYPH
MALPPALACRCRARRTLARCCRNPEPDPASVRAGDELSAAAVPPGGTDAPVETSRGARRGYRVPKEPFILDPLL